VENDVVGTTDRHQLYQVALILDVGLRTSGIFHKIQGILLHVRGEHTYDPLPPSASGPGRSSREAIVELAARTLWQTLLE